MSPKNSPKERCRIIGVIKLGTQFPDRFVTTNGNVTFGTEMDRFWRRIIERIRRRFRDKMQITPLKLESGIRIGKWNHDKESRQVQSLIF